MKTHATILFFQAIIGIAILMASAFHKARDMDRKARLEQVLSLPQSTSKVAALNDPAIIKQFEADVAALKEAYWSYLKKEERANEGAKAAALILVISSLLHSLVIFLRCRNTARVAGRA